MRFRRIAEGSVKKRVPPQSERGAEEAGKRITWVAEERR